MRAERPDLEELRRDHRRQRVPADALARAAARFAESRPRRNALPAWTITAAFAGLLFVALLLSENVGEGVGISEPTMGIAGLSLTELELPPRSELSWSGVSTADLSIAGSVTGSSSGLSEVTSLPFSVPGFSQLTATRNQIN